ncbi:MAG: DUF4458 domain-containing protein [Candidatus Cryptobacteroides sp.]
MRLNKAFFKLAAVLLALLPAFSCAREEAEDLREKNYGYVQFKLYKEASYESKAVVSELDYLRDAGKILLMLEYSDRQISQTLVLGAKDSESAEWGLRSEKLQLLKGTYRITAFTLFDALDAELYNGGPAGEFEIQAGGLTTCDITVKVTPRGKVQFTLEKAFTKAAAREYTFDEVAKADISIKDTGTGVKTGIDGLKTAFSEHFSGDGDSYMTSSLECDSLVLVKGGTYVVDSYTLYDKSGKLLEFNNSVNSAEFTVSDNRTTQVSVPVNLDMSAAYIQDYLALKKIWESLDGPSWYYYGEDWAVGSNWDFNKDPDLWGDQPGVQLHSNGRVALINISDFGFRGDLSPAIGDLSELVELYLGTHNDLNLLEYDPLLEPGMSSENRMERHKAYLAMVHPATPFSEPIARAFKEMGVSLPETRLYDTYSEDQLIEKGTGRSLIQPMDVVHGKLCNGLKSLPEEIGNLKKLETLYIANGEIETLPKRFGELEQLTDLELYNCSRMTVAPEVLKELPSLVSVNMGNNSQMSSGEIEKVLSYLCTGASSGSLQILYLNLNNLRRINGAEVRNVKKLGLFDLAYNRIEEITEAFGQDIGIVQLYLDHNKLSSLPVDENGLFMKVEDVESFTATYNEFTEFPDIFTTDTPYYMGSVSFAFNHISTVQNSGAGYKGLKATTLTLDNNMEMTILPEAFAQSNSSIQNLSFRGCSISKVPSGFFEYENAKYISSIDLSYNRIDDLPSSLNAVNVPYLYGIDLSYNSFKSFPFEPLDSGYLTVLAIRGQRSGGERCLEQWPTGIYNHKALRGFYIGSNNLGKIDDTISTLCYFLEISDNPNIIFDASDICTAYARGQFYLIYDKTQDIRNCQYIELD